MRMSYFPGCSLEGTARALDDTVRESARIVGVEILDLPDWNCCGASSAHAVDRDLAVRLPARNLAIAAREGADLLVPCSACFQRLRHAALALREDPRRWGHDRSAAEREIVHLSTLLARPESLEAIRAAVAAPLAGLSLACYHGCLSLRPPAVTGAQSHEQPTSLPRIVKAVGAAAVRWSHATECCGGSLSLTRPDIVRNLVGEIARAAGKAGAHAIVTDCPMCQANLESRQIDMPSSSDAPRPLPVFFVTEIIAAAAKPPGERDWARGHLVDPEQAVGRIAT